MAAGQTCIEKAKKRIRLIFIMLAVALSLAVTGFAADSDYSSEADALNSMGLFRGTENGYELDRSSTRIEALVSIIRLSGGESEALSGGYETSFTDVDAWAVPYAGYAERHGIANGKAEGLFGSRDMITAGQYVTMLLRTLGYSDSAGDFSYSGALDFAYEAGMLDRVEKGTLGFDDAINRATMVFLMNKALSADTKGGAPLLIRLVRDGVVSESAAYGSMKDSGETEAEITRAVSNGYREHFVKACQKTIDENHGIEPAYREVFKGSIYRWLKEDGTADHTARLVHNLSKLTAESKSAEEDGYLEANDYVAAYFLYPNTIVVRKGMDLGAEENSVTHELRHAMTVAMGSTVMEEGMTELWNQEIDGGYHAYSYYYVNAMKLLTHFAGGRAMNKADLDGGYEYMFNAVKAAGVEFDSYQFHKKISQLNYGYGFDDNMLELQDTLFAMVKSYYESNVQAMAGMEYERFVDEMLAVVQMVYYPSAMIQYVDSDGAENSVSSYYSDEAAGWMKDMISAYCNASGESEQTVSNYYRSARDKRFCLKYFGSDAGSLLVKEGTAYVVSFRDAGELYLRAFGRRADAEAFAKLIGSNSITEENGGAFVIKE